MIRGSSPGDYANPNSYQLRDGTQSSEANLLKNVGCTGYSGKHLFGSRVSHFDPQQTSVRFSPGEPG
jgi:hypothetical protein